MKAMILAAGLGTRLRPLTDNRPKALVEIAGRTLLEITLSSLRTAGVTDAIINVHHFAEMIVDYLEAHQNFGMRLEISQEGTLLDTGGGLKKAAWFFLQDSDPREEPFLLHNVDVLSNIDLTRMLQVHATTGALATLAVQDRLTSRYLLFDHTLQLRGRQTGTEQKQEIVKHCSEPLSPLAFSGIQVISPRLLGMIEDEGAFSIIKTYLQLAARGQKILGFRADEYYWRDLGKPESILKAEEELKQNAISIN